MGRGESSACGLRVFADPLLQKAIKHLQKVRPELAPRLPKLPEEEKDFGPMATMDCTPAREILGMPEFKTWPEVLERTIDSLVAVEKGWEKKA